MLVAVVCCLIYASVKRGRVLEAARKTCQESLSELKRFPTNPDLKQRTLALGRAYSNLTRSKKGVALFDEVALMNDISAACAAAAAPISNAGASPPVVSVESRLRTLADLQAKGLVTSSEYEKRRAEILSHI